MDEVDSPEGAIASETGDSSETEDDAPLETEDTAPDTAADEVAAPGDEPIKQD